MHFSFPQGFLANNMYSEVYTLSGGKKDGASFPLIRSMDWIQLIISAPSGLQQSGQAQ